MQAGSGFLRLAPFRGGKRRLEAHIRTEDQEAGNRIPEKAGKIQAYVQTRKRMDAGRDPELCRREMGDPPGTMQII